MARLPRLQPLYSSTTYFLLDVPLAEEISNVQATPVDAAPPCANEVANMRTDNVTHY